MRPAHAAEMGDLCGVVRQRCVVELLGGIRIERQMELVFPPEFKPGLREGIVANLRAWMTLREVGGVCGDLVGDDADFDIVTVG